ncbi:hypothetical protein DL771_007928 [Monosporascus sp. 5C6A]|nr:hypothetical protein DL771_007928 [Monosporascus sp. 5C6A]
MLPMLSVGQVAIAKFWGTWVDVSRALTVPIPRHSNGGRDLYDDMEYSHMADSFYAKWTRSFDADNTTAWDDIVLQFGDIEAHTRNQTTGLMVHGCDESKGRRVDGPHDGGRTVGSYFLHCSKSSCSFSESLPGHARLVRYFTTLAESGRRAYDGSGGWWLIVNESYPGEGQLHREQRHSHVHPQVV